LFAEDVWPPVLLFIAARSVCLKESSAVDRYETAPWKAVCLSGGSPAHAAGWIGIRPCSNHRHRTDNPAALKESVQPKQALRLRVVTVTHDMHKAHVLAHQRAEKTAEAGKRA
jgi:hypothetical protein